jgi:uncharacterized protein involved in outer membrane biogenesis
VRGKKLFFVGVSFLAVIVVSLSVVPFFVDSNQLKKLIIAQLESRLQRKITAREAGVRIFTGPGIELREVTIADDPGFSKNPFIMVESLVVKAGILSLLRGKIEISDLRITHPVVELIQNREGLWNYSSLMKAPGQGNHPPASSPTTPTPKETGSTSHSTTTQSTPSSLLALASLALREGTLSTIKTLPEGGRQLSRWEHINLDLSDVSQTTASRFALSLGLGGSSNKKLRISGTFGPLNLEEMDKAALDAKLELSEAPVADLIIPFQIATATQWAGTLSTSTHIYGGLSSGFAFDGLSHYSDIAATRGTLESAHVKGEIQYKFSYQFTSGTLKLDHLQLQAPNSTITLSGSIQSQAGDTHLDVALKSPKASFDDLLKLASVFGQGPPNGVQAGGYGQGDLKIKGNTRNLAFSGEAKFSDLNIRYPGLSEKIILSPVTLDFKNNEMQSNPFFASVGERTRLQLQVTSDFGAVSFLNVKVDSEHPVPVNDLQAIGRSFGFRLPEGAKLRDGTVNLQLDVRNRFRPNSELHVEGQSAFSGTVLQVLGLKVPVQIHNALLKFTGNSATVSNLSATLNDIHFNGNVKVAPFNAPAFSFALKLNQVNLSKLPDLIASEGDRNVKHAKMLTPSVWDPLFRSIVPVVYASGGGSSSAQGSMSVLLIQDSSLSIEKVYYEPRVLTNLTSKVRMQNKILDFSDLLFQVDQGDHSGSLTIDFSRPPTKYAYSAKLRNVDANEFLTENVSLKNTIYGKLSSDFELHGNGTNYDQITRNLTGSGKVSIATGRITSFNMSEQVATLGKLAEINLGQSGTEFEDLASDFLIRDGRIFTSNMRVKMTTMRLQGNGSFGFDKTTDCRILAEILSQPGRKTGDSTRLANVATGVLFKNAQGNIVLPLRMTGLITSPKFSLDPQAANDLWKNMLREGSVKDAIESIQDLFKLKKSATPPKASGTPGGKEAGGGDVKPPEKKSSPWEDLLKGVMDQTNQKKKTEEK